MAYCLARAESLTEEEQEALDDKQGSSPAVSNLSHNLICIMLTARRLSEGSQGSNESLAELLESMWRSADQSSSEYVGCFPRKCCHAYRTQLLRS